jgi:hypothetical protein
MLLSQRKENEGIGKDTILEKYAITVDVEVEGRYEIEGGVGPYRKSEVGE